MADLRESRRNRRDELSADEYHDYIRQGVLQSTLYRPNRDPVRVRSVESTSNDSQDSPDRIIVEYDSGFHAIAELYEPEKPTSSVIVILIADDNARGRQVARKLYKQGLGVFHMHTATTHDRQAIMSGKPRCGRWLKLIVSGIDYLCG
jgi:hypothetical protein